MTDTYEYTAELTLKDGSVAPVNLEERGWAHPDRLAQTRVFSLVPKSSGITVSVNIPDGAKPIFKSRRVIGATAGWEFRVYAVGWFKDGESHWLWLLPDGSIEVETDEPDRVRQLTEKLNDEWRQRVGAPRG
jgi:hypothetical protein